MHSSPLIAIESIIDLHFLNAHFATHFCAFISSEERQHLFTKSIHSTLIERLCNVACFHFGHVLPYKIEIFLMVCYYIHKQKNKNFGNCVHYKYYPLDNEQIFTHLDVCVPNRDISIYDVCFYMENSPKNSYREFKNCSFSCCY